MSIVGYFMKPSWELKKWGKELEKQAREREVEAYRRVEDYDPVLRAHCGMDRKE